jgi:hypothetical protein
MKSLIRQLCEYNNCNEEELAFKLHNFWHKNRNYVQQLKLQTIHLNPEERNFPIEAQFITRRNARTLLAIKGEMAITVYKYYYIRHQIRLKYPNLPCIAVAGGGVHLSYFPLELLGVVKEKVIKYAAFYSPKHFTLR